MQVSTLTFLGLEHTYTINQTLEIISSLVSSFFKYFQVSSIFNKFLRFLQFSPIFFKFLQVTSFFSSFSTKISSVLSFFNAAEKLITKRTKTLKTITGTNNYANQFIASRVSSHYIHPAFECF